MKTKTLFLALMVIFATGCNSDEDLSVAYGNFETDELYVSAKANGELSGFTIKKGESLKGGQQVGIIDTTTLHLQIEQMLAKKATLPIAIEELNTQKKLLQLKKENLETNFKRTAELLKNEAATQQQYDNLETELSIASEQIIQLEVKQKSIEQEAKVIDTQIELVRNQIDDCKIINPAPGVVLDKFIENHELCTMGKPLYKLGKLDEMELKAYVSAQQLSNIAIGQTVKVAIDGLGEDPIFYDGKIIWTSPEAEFTPKVIQTPEERLNLVYAIKVLVKNDGKIKIGMPGEVHFGD